MGAAYDAVADDYAATFADDLDHLPLDRSILDATVARLGRGDPVLDLGCGPGQVARYLGDRGPRVVGLDLSPRMLELASGRAPRAGFVCGDMRRLPFGDRSLAAVVAFYSVQHLRRGELGPLLHEIRRIMVPNGLLVIAAHLGHGEVYLDELLGQACQPFGGTFFSRQELEEAMAAASFVDELSEERPPLPHEHPSRRIYLMARRT